MDKALADNSRGDCVLTRISRRRTSAAESATWHVATRRKPIDDVKRAIDDFDKVIELSPQAPAGYYFRGVARFQTKELDKAMEDLNKAIELEPRFANAYQARAQLWEAMGKGDKARADLAKAKSLEQHR